jgi:exodeoxyribonuclease VII large subunit
MEGLAPGDAATRRLASAGGRLAVATGRLQLLDPRRRVAGAWAAMARVGWERPVRMRCDRAAEALAQRGRTLEALSPQRVLERGYSVVRTTAGAVVRRAGQVSAGDELAVQLASGRLSATVDHLDEEQAPGGGR